MQNVKVVKTVSFVLGACTITWMLTLVLLLVNFYNFKANWLCPNGEIRYHIWPWVGAIAFTSSNHWLGARHTSKQLML